MRAAPPSGSKLPRLAPANPAASARSHHSPISSARSAPPRRSAARPYRPDPARPEKTVAIARPATAASCAARVAARVGQAHGVLGPAERDGRTPGHPPQARTLAQQPGRERLVVGPGVGPVHDPGPGDLDRRDDPVVVVLGHDADGPVGEERRRHPDRRPRLGLEAPLEGGPEIVELRIEAVEPVDHRRAAHRLLGLDREGRVHGQVTVRHGGRLAGRDELFARVLADRLEHPVPHRVAVHEHERAIDEAGQTVFQVEGIHPAGVVADDPGRHRDRPAPAEHRQAPEQAAVLVVEEVPAPIDHRVERLLARDGRPAAPGQQTEPVAQPHRDVVRRHRRDARRRELDRQRDAVESLADLDDRGHVGIAKRERRVGGGGPLGEQPDGLRRGRAARCRPRVTGRLPIGERRPPGRTGTAAGGRPRRGPRAPRGSWSGCAGPARSRAAVRRTVRDAVDEVLGVVEQEQQVLVGEERRDRREAGTPGISGAPSARATSDGICDGSPSGASSASHTPSA